MSDDDLIRRGSVLERLELSEHDAEERDWRSGANEIARLRKYIAALPAHPAPVEDARAVTVAQAAQVLLDAMTARPPLADPFDACDVEVERLAIEYSSQGGDAVMVLETAEKFMLAGLRALIHEAKP